MTFHFKHIQNDVGKGCSAWVYHNNINFKRFFSSITICICTSGILKMAKSHCHWICHPTHAMESWAGQPTIPSRNHIIYEKQEGPITEFLRPRCWEGFHAPEFQENFISIFHTGSDFGTIKHPAAPKLCRQVHDNVNSIWYLCDIFTSPRQCFFSLDEVRFY